MYSVSSRRSGFKLLTQVEKDNTFWIEDVVRRHTSSRNMVVGAYAGMFPASKAFMHLPKYSRLIGYKIKARCVAMAVAQLFSIYARHVLCRE